MKKLRKYSLWLIFSDYLSNSFLKVWKHFPLENSRSIIIVKFKLNEFNQHIKDVLKGSQVENDDKSIRARNLPKSCFFRPCKKCNAIRNAL